VNKDKNKDKDKDKERYNNAENINKIGISSCFTDLILFYTNKSIYDLSKLHMIVQGSMK
jgi:hypothetical protein